MDILQLNILLGAGAIFFSILSVAFIKAGFKYNHKIQGLFYGVSFALGVVGCIGGIIWGL